MRKLSCIAMCLLLLLLPSCYNKRSVGYLQDRSSLPDYGKGVFEAYRLQVNDEIVIRVITSDVETASLFQSQSGSASQAISYRIFADGTVDLPFLSYVPLEGKTLNEAQQLIKSRLETFTPDIQVKVALATGTFCVIGDAGRGYFPIYKERLTIFQALAMAGGVNESGNFHQVKIIRQTDKGTKIMSFDIRTQSIIGSEYYYIYPNDVIYVEVSKKRFWAVNSYASFLGLVTSSITLLVTVWSLFYKQ